jgi:hypothetical protein
MSGVNRDGGVYAMSSTAMTAAPKEEAGFAAFAEMTREEDHQIEPGDDEC